MHKLATTLSKTRGLPLVFPCCWARAQSCITERRFRASPPISVPHVFFTIPHTSLSHGNVGVQQGPHSFGFKEALSTPEEPNLTLGPGHRTKSHQLLPWSPSFLLAERLQQNMRETKALETAPQTTHLLRCLQKADRDCFPPLPQHPGGGGEERYYRMELVGRKFRTENSEGFITHRIHCHKQL